LLFGETGRIQDQWSQGVTPLKWSGGIGLRFKGKVLDSHRTVIRFYVAQAGEYRTRQPVFYALADVLP
jgi:hypothetical protein